MQKHAITHHCPRWGGMHCPRSSEAMAPRMPATCHSLMSRYSSMASAARKARLRPVLLASCCHLALVERARRTETVSVFIGVQYSTDGGFLLGGRPNEAMRGASARGGLACRKG